MAQNRNYTMARAPKKRARLDNLTKGLLIAFAVVGIILAYIGGNFIFNLVKGWTITALPGAPVAPTTDPNATAVANQPGQTNDTNLTPWNGKSRVNILLMGLDYSTERETRGLNEKLTDTMILVTIDPISQTIGALSIRRDLWVEIPEGFGYDKINTAYSKGEINNLPGGGPGLAAETVENLLGIDINYYAVVNLDTFVKLIDEIDGITITFTTRLKADWEGNGNVYWIEPGTYTLPGSHALAYARCRSDCGDELGDVGRGNRQMEVITAIRDRILKFDMLPTLISRAPALYQELSAGIKTNMSLDDAMQLATLMVKIPRENMTTYNITYDECEPQRISYNGYPYDVLIPYPDKLRLLRDKMFSSGAATAPITLATGDSLTLAKSEGARIQVLNGTLTGDLADTTAALLQSQGLNVVSTGNTDATTYTKIVITGAAPYTASYLQNLMAVSGNMIVYHFDSSAGADVIVYLGDDWVGNSALTQP
jgi:LCP family protein required for cell wall assembly